MMGLTYLRGIDKAILRIIAIVHIASGLYLAGPLYITKSDGQPSPLYGLFESHIPVIIYGVLILLNGISLWYATTKRNKSNRVLTLSLQSGFILRLYSLIGVLTGAPLLPPGWLSQAALMLVLGAYWLWVKSLVKRPPQ